MNDLSVPTADSSCGRDEALDLLSDFTDLLRGATAIRPDLALASSVALASAPVTADGLTFGSIVADVNGASKEQWRYVRSRQNFAPFSTAPDLPPVPLDEDWCVGGVRSVGLGLAASAGQLAVSLRSDVRWDVADIELLKTTLVEADGSDESEVEEVTLTVRHASQVEHLGTHHEFIANLALPDPFSGADLWNDRQRRYPNLRLLTRVQAQVLDLGHGSDAVRNVHARLGELDAAVGDWNPASTAFPPWRSRVTPEHQKRKLLCDFVDELDGLTYCFDMHARFQPDVGRIHFRIVHGPPATLRIAHIGRKL